MDFDNVVNAPILKGDSDDQKVRMNILHKLFGQFCLSFCPVCLTFYAACPACHACHACPSCPACPACPVRPDNPERKASQN